MLLHAGTSGFSYPSWKGPFYPEKTKPAEMLGIYAARLGAVEINNTFYRMPATAVLESWCAQTPSEFRFAVKASRKITHQQRLKETDDSTGYLFKQLAALGDRLGAVLFQLPPYLKKDLDRLAAFVGLLPAGVKCVIEFRSPDWFSEDVYDLLKSHNVACGFADGEVEGEPFVVTADFGYIRLREERYEKPALKAWAEKIKSQKWKEAFVFFKHEDDGIAPAMARGLIEEFESL